MQLETRNIVHFNANWRSIWLFGHLELAVRDILWFHISCSPQIPQSLAGFVFSVETSLFNLFLNLRVRHASGTEAEVDPHAAAHAPRCQLGLQQQRASTAPGKLLPLHPHGHRHPTHLHPAGCLLPHWYPKAGNNRAVPLCYRLVSVSWRSHIQMYIFDVRLLMRLFSRDFIIVAK